MKDNKKEMKVITISYRIEKAVPYRGSKEACQIFKDMLHYEGDEFRDREHFWVMGIDKTGYIVCIYIVALGTGNALLLTPAELISVAVSFQATSIVIAHNHPSEKVKPSKEDIDATDSLYHACLVVSIRIVDHITIGANDYYSFADNGDIDSIKKSTKYKAHIHAMIEAQERLDEIEEIVKKRTKFEIAKNMLLDGITTETIIKYTKLSEDTISKIQKKLPEK